MAAQIIAFPKGRIARSKQDRAMISYYFKQYRATRSNLSPEQCWSRAVTAAMFRKAAARIIAERQDKELPEALVDKITQRAKRAPALRKK